MRHAVIHKFIYSFFIFLLETHWAIHLVPRKTPGDMEKAQHSALILIITNLIPQIWICCRGKRKCNSSLHISQKRERRKKNNHVWGQLPWETHGGGSHSAPGFVLQEDESSCRWPVGADGICELGDRLSVASFTAKTRHPAAPGSRAVTRVGMCDGLS